MWPRILTTSLLVFLATAANAQTALGNHPLVDVANVTDDIVQVIATDELPGGFFVYVIGAALTPGYATPPEWRPRRQLEELDLQAWVLLRNGTTLRSTAKPTCCAGRGNGPYQTTMMIFRFAKANQKDIAGVVISADRSLYA